MRFFKLKSNTPDPRLAELEEANRALRNQVEYLVRTIRDMDQEIWNMAQRIDWNGKLPHFQKLYEEMIARKVMESKRIGEIVRKELIDTYTPNPEQKRIAND